MAEHQAEVVVIGAGPAGIAAAAVAAECGRTTLLVDEAAAPGGQVWRGAGHGAGRTRSAARWLARLDASRARFLGNTTIVDVDEQLQLHGEQAGAAVRIRATSTVILAVGARELFLPFPGWTLPGVIGAGGAQALLKSGWDARGRAVLVAGSGPLLLPVAAALAASGARVIAVAEQADRSDVMRFARSLWRTPSRAAAALRYRAAFARVPYRTGTWVTRASGDSVLREVTLRDGTAERTVACDTLCFGYGLVPAIELPLLFGCATTNDSVVVDDFQRTSVTGVFCAGEPTGIAGLDAALVQGTIAGLAAAGRETQARSFFPARAAHAAFARRVLSAFSLRTELARPPDDDTVVCRCEDIAYGSVRGCGSLREAKLLTRAGMGACQGRVCGSALRHFHGGPRDSVRPPISPVSIAVLARAPQSGRS